MHKLVHAWGQDRLDGEMQRQTSGAALALLADATTDVRWSPSYKLRLVPHLMANYSLCLQRATSICQITRDERACIEKIAGFLYSIGRWSEAYEVRTLHLRKTEEALGRDHPDTLQSMDDLFSVLDDQRNYKIDQLIFRMNLALMSMVLCKKCPSKLRSRNNLASALSVQNKYQGAEPIYRQNLALNQTLHGREHPNSLGSMLYLTGFLQRQGKYQEAEPICRQALALHETVLGKEHPQTLLVMVDLGTLLKLQRKRKEAKSIYRQVLALHETVLVREHPQKLWGSYHVAALLKLKENFNDAGVLYREIIADCKELGENHPEMLACTRQYSSMVEEENDQPNVLKKSIIEARRRKLKP